MSCRISFMNISVRIIVIFRILMVLSCRLAILLMFGGPTDIGSRSNAF